MIATLIFLVGLPVLVVMIVVAEIMPGLRLDKRPAAPIRLTLGRLMILIVLDGTLFGVWFVGGRRAGPYDPFIFAIDPCYASVVFAFATTRPLSKIDWMTLVVFLGFSCWVALMFFLYVASCIS
jgi:hypothetical protein